MKRLFTGFAVLLVLVATASAQYGPQGEKPFTGFHFGGYAGGTWSESKLTMSTEDAGTYFLASDVTQFNLAGLQRPEDRAFVGGGSFGYDYQGGENWVFGFEVTFGSMRIDSTADSGDIPYDSAPLTTFRIVQQIDTNWLFEVRPRFGYAVGNWMPYVTGGLALTDMSYTGTFTDTFGPALEFASRDRSRAGWSIGGGIEYKPSKHFSIKGEYIYSDFGDDNIPTTSMTVGGAPPVLGPQPVNHHVELKTHSARAGFNFWF